MSFILKLLRPILRWYSHRASDKSLSDYNQPFELRGLSQRVEIVRDKWAVAHIYAQTESDLFAAQGFTHGQDRFFQMDLWRRIASGQLSEVFGKKTLNADKTLRTLGFRRLAEKDWERLQGTDLAPLLQAYSEGVNAYLDAHQERLSVEFKLLRYKPKAWTPVDSLAIGRFLSMQMSFGWLHQIERMQWVQILGEERASELFIQYPKDNPISFPQNETYERLADGSLRAFSGAFLRPIGGSNNWAVSAEKMADTQSAALCNDPHLVLNNPNIWIENHLISPTYECTGVSVAGVPLVLIGHNRRIAWGATLSFVDMQDVYIERLIGKEAKQYEAGSEIRLTQQIQEQIYVKGSRSPHIETISSTHHGVIISDIIAAKSSEKGTALSLYSPALSEDNEMMRGFYLLNKADGWNDFLKACACIHAPSLNLAYADTDDNIGYFCTGKVSIRNKPKNGLPLCGYDGQQEPTGFVPFEAMPQAFNPPSGYLYTCNNRLVGEDYPYDLGHLWMNGYRAKRLQQLFAGQKQYTLADFEHWQNDVYSTAAPAWISLFADLLPKLGAEIPQIQREACQLLADWNAEVSATSAAASIYHVVLQTLIEQIITERSSAEVSRGLRGKGQLADLFKHMEFWSHDADALLRIISNPQSAWWRKGDTTENFLVRALATAVDTLQKRLGGSPQTWAWGKIHQITFNHALGVQAPFDEWFNLSGIATGGDKDTLNQQSFMPNEQYGGTICAASYRQIIDMGNLSNSRCIAPLGQSANIKSPHFADQLPLWRDGHYKPMLWTREQVSEYSAYKSQLTPKK